MASRSAGRVQFGAEREGSLAMRGGPVERDQVGEPVDLVDERRAELAARRDEGRRRRLVTAAAPAIGRAIPDTSRNATSVTPERRRREAPSSRPANAVTSPATTGGIDDPDVEVLERLDVGDDPGEQVAAPARRQPGRGERLDRGEEPDPQVGQDRERRAVGHVPLEVAERGPPDGEDADGGDRRGRPRRRS